MKNVPPWPRGHSWSICVTASFFFIQNPEDIFMKKLLLRMKHCFASCAAALVLAVATLPTAVVIQAASASEFELVVKEGNLYRAGLKGGRILLPLKTVDDGEMRMEQPTGVKGIGFLIVVEPAASPTPEKFRELARGVYLFDNGGKFIRFFKIPVDDSEDLSDLGDIILSPDGRYAVFSWGTSPERVFQIVEIATAKTMREFGGYSSTGGKSLVWLDAERFVVAVLDETRGYRSQEEIGYTSVVMYDLHDSSFKKVLAAATATEDFQLPGDDIKPEEIFSDGGLFVQKCFVTDVKDWEKPDKWKYANVRISVSAR
jgi:hypothetical protein